MLEVGEAGNVCWKSENLKLIGVSVLKNEFYAPESCIFGAAVYIYRYEISPF